MGKRNAGVVRDFITAFNERDLEGFIRTLHPDVEIHAARGLRRGRDEAREWATRPRGGVQQRILIEEIDEREDRVLALIVREWWWDEDEEIDGNEPAGADVMAWLFELRDGLIASWRAYDERAEAHRAYAFGPGTGSSR